MPRNPFTRMLLDPCNAPLSLGAYNERFDVERVVSELTVSLPPGSSYHLIWFPKYHCGNTVTPDMTVTSRESLFSFWTSSPGSTQVVNTVTSAWGNYISLGGETAYRYHPDPAFDLVSSSTISGGRTLAACCELEYTGRDDSASGTYTVLSGSRLDNLFQPEQKYDEAKLNWYTYDQMYVTGRDNSRPPRGTEVLYRPPPGDPAEFIGSNHSPIVLGTSGSTATTVNVDHLNEENPAYIGFALRAASDTATYTIRFTKILEVKRAAHSFSIANTQPTIVKAGPAPLTQAVALLDKVAPNWSLPSIASKLTGMDVIQGAGHLLGTAARAFTQGSRDFRAIGALP